MTSWVTCINYCNFSSRQSDLSNQLSRSRGKKWTNEVNSWGLFLMSTLYTSSCSNADHHHRQASFWCWYHTQSLIFGSVSYSVISHSLGPIRFLSPWNSPGKNFRVGCHSPIQEIFPIQGSKPRVPALQAGFFFLPSELPSLTFSRCQMNKDIIWVDG